MALCLLALAWVWPKGSLGRTGKEGSEVRVSIPLVPNAGDLVSLALPLDRKLVLLLKQRNRLAAACPSFLHGVPCNFPTPWPHLLNYSFVSITFFNCLNLIVPFVSCWNPHKYRVGAKFLKNLKRAQEQKI